MLGYKCLNLTTVDMTLGFTLDILCGIIHIEQGKVYITCFTFSVAVYISTVLLSCNLLRWTSLHYKNMSMQYIEVFLVVKIEKEC